MRENRTSGSEGGEPVKSRLPYPYRPTVFDHPFYHYIILILKWYKCVSGNLLS